MNEKLKYFTYSQNSLNTYKSCPFKFKYKYMDNINWKYDDVESIILKLKVMDIQHVSHLWKCSELL